MPCHGSFAAIAVMTGTIGIYLMMDMSLGVCLIGIVIGIGLVIPNFALWYYWVWRLVWIGTC